MAIAPEMQPDDESMKTKVWPMLVEHLPWMGSGYWFKPCDHLKKLTFNVTEGDTSYTTDKGYVDLGGRSHH